MNIEIIKNSKLFWILICGTTIGELVVPFILSYFYGEKYDSKKMAMSVLANKNSPVRYIYSCWLLWVGVMMVILAFVVRDMFYNYSRSKANIIGIMIAIFAVGACIISVIFPVGEVKTINTVSAKIHGFAAAIGFMTLLFVPLLLAVTYMKQKQLGLGWINLVAFVLAFFFFVLFIMSDKKEFSDTIIAYEGVWQRLTLGCMYIPYIAIAIHKFNGKGELL